ncbi:hypothetical protein BCY86_04075 [Pajaroellobacter abortibovis]|uniref:Uncharacterized protein n=1 Tax=Pajaroellobacter abortibovis TaxID=1882918 RepID=A0A1L6MWL2_9BACT|nr:hypothetical protein BCY86_04075 [Pajaroellobacter abortibovis]
MSSDLQFIPKDNYIPKDLPEIKPFCQELLAYHLEDVIVPLPSRSEQEPGSLRAEKRKPLLCKKLSGFWG